MIRRSARLDTDQPRRRSKNEMGGSYIEADQESRPAPTRVLNVSAPAAVSTMSLFTSANAGAEKIIVASAKY